MADVLDMRGRADAVLRDAYGPSATFRDGQWEAIGQLVVAGRRLLVVERTGWGKSVVYLVATRLLRDDGAGPTIIVSPLLALMRDQIAAAERMGVRAATLNSSNVEEWEEIHRDLLAGDVDILLVSPERLNNRRFREELLIPLTERAGLFVIDEAHCISDWGHDFRPDYRRIIRITNLLPDGIPVLCTTATANDRVVGDIVAQLGDSLAVIRGPLDRESLSLSARRLDTRAERLAWLAEWVPEQAGTGIVYCLTVDDTRGVAAWLQHRGIDAVAYSSEAPPEERLEIERRLRENDVKVVCATSALGMGFDKPDLAFVVHYQSPDSPVAYYQQVGRAGRALPHAEGVLLSGVEDQEIWNWFLGTSLPVQSWAEAVIGQLDDRADWVSLGELEAAVNMRQGRLEALLKILEVDGAVEADGRKYRRTLAPWTFDRARIDRVRAARLAEQELMRAYATSSGCRMRFLREALDDSGATDCGRCDNCRAEGRPAPPRRDLVLEAIRFLRHRPVAIEPRKQWTWPRSGRIPEEHRLQEGRALARLSDGGYGSELLSTKHAGGLVSDEIVEASAELIREWLPDVDFTVVPVPASRADRNLVPDFARRLARALGVLCAEPVVKVRATQPQKLMENSAQQLDNVDGAFEVHGLVPDGPIILVDDVSDSGWTMTVIADILAVAGARDIHPFAIAKTKKG